VPVSLLLPQRLLLLLLLQGATDIRDISSLWRYTCSDPEDEQSLIMPEFASESEQQQHYIAALISLAVKYETNNREMGDRYQVCLQEGERYLKMWNASEAKVELLTQQLVSTALHSITHTHSLSLLLLHAHGCCCHIVQ
jgi:hypothetical protein